MALGLAAFATLALFGLLSMGLEGGRSAVNDTAIARISEIVLAELKTRPFPDLESVITDLYFKESGIRTNSAGDALFLCKVQTAEFAIPGVFEPADAASSVRVQMTFFSPPDNPNSLDVLETVISKY